MPHEGGADPIVLFSGGADGYGDAVNVGRDSYHWTFNSSCLALGRMLPSLVPQSVGLSTGDIINIAAQASAFEWQDTGGNPILLIPNVKIDGGAVKRALAKIEDTAFTTAVLTGGIYEDGILYRYDKDATTDPDEEMAWLSSGGEGSQSVIARRKLDGTLSASGHDARADVFGVVGGDLWRSKAYKASKLTSDTDPGTDSNWGTGIPAGRPTYEINKILELGGSPILLKGDGVFRYNPAPSSARFDNLTPFIPAHKDNGKGGFADGRGRIYYPTVDGDILVVTFGAQSQQGPVRLNWIDRDTPWGYISQIAAGPNHIYAVTEPGSIRTQQLGVTFLDFDDSTATFHNHTTNCTDQKDSTTADLNLIGDASDFLYFGADEPFAGMFIEITNTNAGVGTSLGTVAYSAGSDTWTNTTLLDSTGVLRADGCLALLPSTDIFADGLWLKNTVNSISKYWIRISLTSVLASVYVCPYRPSPDTAQHFHKAGIALSGVLPELLVGTWRGENIVWQHVWTIESSRVMMLVVGRTRGANSTGRLTLWSIAREEIFYMPIGADSDPVRAAWPLTNDNVPHWMFFSGHAFGAPSHVKEVRKLIVYGEYLQDDDEFWVYWRWDQGDRWHKNGPHTKFPVVVEDLTDSGRILYVAVALKDGSRDAIAPYTSWAEVPEGEWEDLGPLAEPIGADIASPQTF